MPRLESRRIDEHILHADLGQNTADAVARCLWLFGRDAYPLTDERVEQRGLADVRPTDDRDRATAKGVAFLDAHPRSRSYAARAASCSAMRRLVPPPIVRRSSSRIKHSTSK